MIAAARALVAGRTAWWAPALIALLTSAVIGPCLLLRVLAEDPDVVMGGAVMTGTAILAAVVVMAVVASAAVAARTEDLARWRLAGAGPWRLAELTMAQLLLAVAAGATVGTLTVPLTGPGLAHLLNDLIAPGRPLGRIPLLPSVLVTTLLAPIGLVVIAGGHAVRRALRAPAIRAIVPAEQGIPRIGILRWSGAVIGLAALALGVIAVIRHPAGSIAGAADGAVGLGFLVILAVALGARALVPALLAGWTRLIPVRSAVWEVARAGAIARARTSAATVVALGVGVAVLCMISGLAYTLQDIMQRMSGEPVEMNLLDTRLISAVIGVLAAAGGVCVLALGAAARRREVALLRSAGMSPTAVIAMIGCEAVILALTAVLVGALATVATIGTLVRTALVLDLPLDPMAGVPWGELAVCVGITVPVIGLAMLVPAVRAVAASVRETLAAT